MAKKKGKKKGKTVNVKGYTYKKKGKTIHVKGYRRKK